MSRGERFYASRHVQRVLEAGAYGSLALQPGKKRGGNDPLSQSHTHAESSAAGRLMTIAPADNNARTI